MSDNPITEIRSQLKEKVSGINNGRAKVLMTNSDTEGKAMGKEYGDLHFVVRFLTVGPSPDADERVDDVIHATYQNFRTEPRMNGHIVQIKSCSGHRVYKAADGDKLGCEFVVKVS